jgi:hypothetical protein
MRVACRKKLDVPLGRIRNLLDRIAGLKPDGYIGRELSGN